MRFSLNFIQEFFKVELSPKKLAQKLTMAGMEVECFERLGNDWVFEIEVTTNRYDWLSLVGISQEIAAVLGRKAKIQYPPKEKEAQLKERVVVIEDTRDCPYYIGRSIKGVKVGRSSAKIKDLITNCGLTAVNDIVDITNYCMLKWGNPLHAFDEDKLKGNICIRRAKPGESFIGIDGKERFLDKENLVIADERKVVALAGVMGSKNSEVDEKTKNIFLEAAIFSPVTLRSSRRIAGIETESSFRFERRVNPGYLEYAAYEAARLIAEKTKGKLQGVCRRGRKPIVLRKKLTLNLNSLEAYLGISFRPAQVKSILGSLGFALKSKPKGEYLLLAPSHRFDITSPVDVYEELSRIYGYEKIPAKLPFLKKNIDWPQENQQGGFYHFNNQLADYLALLGFKEIVTYSIEDQQELGAFEPLARIKVVNPLCKQENSLRPNLLLGMIKSMGNNLNRNQSQLRFFELAHTYLKGKSGFSEVQTLSLGASGEKESFFYLKGAVEKIFQYIHNPSFEFRKAESPYLSAALNIVLKDSAIGFLGKVKESIKKHCDLKEDLFFAQLNIAALMDKAKEAKYKPFSFYPAVSRDLSLLLAKGFNFKAVEEIIKAKSNYLAGLRIVDIYQGKDISEDAVAFTLRIFYQSPERTLTSQEVDSFHSQIREALLKQKGIQLR